MSYFLHGYTNQEVADLLKISRHTVNSYVISMKRKLGCRSKVELVAKVCQTHFLNQLDELF